MACEILKPSLNFQLNMAFAIKNIHDRNKKKPLKISKYSKEKPILFCIDKEVNVAKVGFCCFSYYEILPEYI